MSVLKPVLIFLVERLTVAGAGVAAALAAFLVLAHAVHGGETQRFDAEMFHFFQDRQEPIVHRLMLCVSLACLLVFWRKPARRWDASNLLLAAAGGQGVVYGLKALFHRARPEAVFASLGYSFPSGHAFAAVTLYGMLAYWLARGQERPRAVGVWGAGILLILLIGFSRIYLGVHYASDVAAGFAAGLPWLWGCLALPSRTQSPLRV